MKIHFLEESPKRLPHIKKYSWKTFGGMKKKVWHGVRDGTVRM